MPCSMLPASIHPPASNGQSLYAWALTNLQKSHECSCCRSTNTSRALSRNFAECAKSVKQCAGKHTDTHWRILCVFCRATQKPTNE